MRLIPIPNPCFCTVSTFAHATWHLVLSGDPVDGKTKLLRKHKPKLKEKPTLSNDPCIFGPYTPTPRDGLREMAGEALGLMRFRRGACTGERRVGFG